MKIVVLALVAVLWITGVAAKLPRFGGHSRHSVHGRRRSLLQDGSLCVWDEGTCGTNDGYSATVPDDELLTVQEEIRVNSIKCFAHDTDTEACENDVDNHCIVTVITPDAGRPLSPEEFAMVGSGPSLPGCDIDPNWEAYLQTCPDSSAELWYECRINRNQEDCEETPGCGWDANLGMGEESASQSCYHTSLLKKANLKAGPRRRAQYEKWLAANYESYRKDVYNRLWKKCLAAQVRYSAGKYVSDCQRQTRLRACQATPNCLWDGISKECNPQEGAYYELFLSGGGILLDQHVACLDPSITTEDQCAFQG